MLLLTAWQRKLTKSSAWLAVCGQLCLFAIRLELGLWRNYYCENCRRLGRGALRPVALPDRLIKMHPMTMLSLFVGCCVEAGSKDTFWSLLSFLQCGCFMIHLIITVIYKSWVTLLKSKSLLKVFSPAKVIQHHLWQRLLNWWKFPYAKCFQFSECGKVLRRPANEVFLRPATMAPVIVGSLGLGRKYGWAEVLSQNSEIVLYYTIFSFSGVIVYQSCKLFQFCLSYLVLYLPLQIISLLGFQLLYGVFRVIEFIFANKHHKEPNKTYYIELSYVQRWSLRKQTGREWGTRCEMRLGVVNTFQWVELAALLAVALPPAVLMVEEA